MCVPMCVSMCMRVRVAAAGPDGLACLLAVAWMLALALVLSCLG